MTPKPLVTGFVIPFRPPSATYRSWGITAWTATERWANLQPQPFGPIVHPNDLDAAIGVSAELQLQGRVFCGRYAPDWVKQIGQGPLTLVDTFDQAGAFTVPDWTDPDVVHAYADFQFKMAADYDRSPFLAMMMTMASTLYGEPFVRQIASEASREALAAAGITAEADIRAHYEMVLAHALAWRETRSGYALSPFQHVRPDGTSYRSVPDSIAAAARARNVLGEFCVLQSNSLDNPASKGADYRMLYAGMDELAPPIGFQTEQTRRWGGDNATTEQRRASIKAGLDYAVSIGATAIEFSTGGWEPVLPAAEIRSYTDKLTANA